MAVSFATATDVVNFLNDRGNLYESAYVTGLAEEYVILPQFYSAGQKLILPAEQLGSDGLTYEPIAIGANIKFVNIQMQPIKVTQSGQA